MLGRAGDVLEGKGSALDPPGGRAPWTLIPTGSRQHPDMFPDTIQTERLLLRPIRHADAVPIFRRYAGDREVCRYLTWQPHASVAQTEAYIASCLSATTARTYAIVLPNGPDLVGAFDLRRAVRFKAEYGYVLARSEWGKGLMTEALTAVVGWALAQPDIWRIGAVCDIDNVGSARVMEKSGLTREGILRRWIMHPNIAAEPRDCISFAKIR